MSNKQQSPIDEFLQLFTDSAAKTLSQNLDKDTCKSINFYTESSSQVHDLEALAEGDVIYKTDFAISGEPSSMAVMIPELLLASISDILMGGNGEVKPKDSIDELEVNAVSDLLKKVFKGLEGAFKYAHAQDLTFSADPSMVLKEMPEYSLKSEDMTFDLLISSKLVINDEKEFIIRFLFNNQLIQKLLSNLGFIKASPTHKERKSGGMDISKLADVEIEITAQLGSTSVPIKYALELVPNSIVELDTLSNSDIKVFANGVEVALAQVVAVEDNFGLKITKIISPEERLGSL